jgi:hypothetical protein
VIPALLVPLYVLTHVAIFMRLVREASPSRRAPVVAA